MVVTCSSHRGQPNAVLHSAVLVYTLEQSSVVGLNALCREELTECPMYIASTAHLLHHEALHKLCIVLSTVTGIVS